MCNPLGAISSSNPGPATTTDTVKQALVVPDICPREQEFGALVGAVRRKLVEVVNGARTHMAVLFAASGTGAVEAVVELVVGPGDRILIHSNGAYGRRMIEIGRVFLAPDQSSSWSNRSAPTQTLPVWKN